MKLPQLWNSGIYFKRLWASYCVSLRMKITIWGKSLLCCIICYSWSLIFFFLRIVESCWSLLDSFHCFSIHVPIFFFWLSCPCFCWIPVCLSGPVARIDRPCVLTISDSGTSVSGEDSYVSFYESHQDSVDHRMRWTMSKSPLE